MIRKKGLEIGKYYKIIHRQQGEVITRYEGNSSLNKNKIRFLVIDGGVDNRIYIDTKPKLFKYYYIPILDLDI